MKKIIIILAIIAALLFVWGVKRSTQRPEIPRIESLNIAPTLAQHMQFTRQWEGTHARPYRDGEGWSIGVGHHFPKGERVPQKWTRYEIENAFTNDMRTAIADAKKIFSNYDKLPPSVQLVIADMSFNLGRPRLSKFKNMIAACHDEDFSRMADEMQNSLWYRQTGARARHHVGAVKSFSTDSQ
jgi:lysozyme